MPIQLNTPFELVVINENDPASLKVSWRTSLHHKQPHVVVRFQINDAALATTRNRGQTSLRLRPDNALRLTRWLHGELFVKPSFSVQSFRGLSVTEKGEMYSKERYIRVGLDDASLGPDSAGNEFVFKLLRSDAVHLSPWLCQHVLVGGVVVDGHIQWRPERKILDMVALGWRPLVPGDILEITDAEVYEGAALQINRELEGHKVGRTGRFFRYTLQEVAA